MTRGIILHSIQVISLFSPFSLRLIFHNSEWNVIIICKGPIEKGHWSVGCTTKDFLLIYQ